VWGWWWVRRGWEGSRRVEEKGKGQGKEKQYMYYQYC